MHIYARFMPESRNCHHPVSKATRIEESSTNNIAFWKAQRILILAYLEFSEPAQLVRYIYNMLGFHESTESMQFICSIAPIVEEKNEQPNSPTEPSLALLTHYNVQIALEP